MVFPAIASFHLKSYITIKCLLVWMNQPDNCAGGDDKDHAAENDSLFSLHIRSSRNLVLLKAQPCKGQHNRSHDCIQDGPHGKGVKNKPADLVGNILTDFRHEAAVRQQEQSQVVRPGCSIGGEEQWDKKHGYEYDQHEVRAFHFGRQQ